MLVCVRTKRTERGVELTTWRDKAEALEAWRELCHPCGRWCEGNHIVVYGEGDRLRAVGECPPAPPLSVELEACYPRHFGDGVDAWPIPPELNEDLGRPLTASPLPEQIQRGHRISLARLLATAP
jgi:hypothetical protein